jgi:myo-inositol-1(or 4)-monophosphatase
MPTGSSPSEGARLAADCLEIAERAAAVALRGFRKRPEIRAKSHKDLVTEFDVACQELALSLLAERHPGVPVIAEEGDLASASPGRGLCFAVDPIDGTTNFAHGHPIWCVSIGMLLDGEPFGGAVVAPAIATRWHGHREGGGGRVYRNGEPCRTSETTTLEEALVATGFPPNRDVAPDNNFASFERVKRRALAVRRCGAAAIDLCFVADGTYDAYWERRLHLWDLAAGAGLVLAAGGRATDLEGAPARWTHGHVAVSNGLVHDALIEAIGAQATSSNSP